MPGCVRCSKVERHLRRRLCNACTKYVKYWRLEAHFPKVNYSNAEFLAKYDQLQSDAVRRTGKRITRVVAAQLLGRSISTLEHHLRKRNGASKNTQS